MPKKTSGWIAWWDGARARLSAKFSRETTFRVAAQGMYEHFQGDSVGDMAENSDQTENGILEWFGDYLLLIAPVRGRRLPSMVFLELDRDNVRATDGCGAVVEIIGAGRYDDIMIKKRDVAKAIVLLERMHLPIAGLNYRSIELLDDDVIYLDLPMKKKKTAEKTELAKEECA